MTATVTLETLKGLALGLAKKQNITQDQATLILIHQHGFENVDFTGGARADNTNTHKVTPKAKPH